MGDEVELISDGEGLAVLGSPSAVERFVTSAGLSPTASPASFGSVFSAAAGVAQAGSEVAASSGRWVKLTKESAEAVSKYGLTPTKTPGVSHAMVGEAGDIKQWIQIVTTPGSIVTNPAVLAGAAGIMSQMAMKQQMDAIQDYLAVIDEKLDDVIRTQTNQVLARMDGVDLTVREAMSLREAVGRVSEITWSKVQHQSATIFETQAFALRQLADLADKVDGRSKVGELATASQEIEADVQKWLVVLAKCFELHDAIGVLELDRVLDAAPDELDRHRLGLMGARRDRLEIMSLSTRQLLTRMSVAADAANSKVLFHPSSSPAVVESRNRVAGDVGEFHGLLGIQSGNESGDPTRWREAAAERIDAARSTGSQGVEIAKKVSSRTRDHARTMRNRAADGMIEGRIRNVDGEEAESDEVSVVFHDVKDAFLMVNAETPSPRSPRGVRARARDASRRVRRPDRGPDE